MFTDYGNQHPVACRATISGDLPLSVNGRRSATRSKQ